MMYLVLLTVLPLGLLISRWLWHLYTCSARDSSSSLPLPPGSVGWPFVGEMADLVYATVKGNDFFTDRRLQYGNIFKTHVMGRPTVRLLGPENVKQVLQSEHISVVPCLPQSAMSLLEVGRATLITAVGAHHRANRKLVMKAFTKDALVGYTHALHGIIRDELSTWTASSPVTVFNLSEKLAVRAAWEVLVGLRNFQEVNRYLVVKFRDFLRGFWTLALPVPGTPFYKAQEANKIIMDIIRDQYKARLSSDFEGYGYQDALSLVMSAARKHERPLNEDEISGIIKEFLFAGHSTTSSAVTSLVMYLGKYPEVLDKLRKELEGESLLDVDTELSYEKLTGLVYLGDVINEVLRLSPPAGGGYRKTTQTMEIGGYQIPKGWTILWSVFDTHEVCDAFKDERYKFKPERWADLRAGKDITYSYLPFGTGARSCVGKEFAKIVLRVFTVNLVRMFDWRLINPDVKMARLPVRHPEDNLPAVFTARCENLCMESVKDTPGITAQCQRQRIVRNNQSHLMLR